MANEKRCSNCDNYPICNMKDAADEFARKLGGRINTLDLYKILAEECGHYTEVEE